jgi:hypothetical protein
VRPYLKKNLSQKRAGGVAQSVGPEFKLQYHRGGKKNRSFFLVVSRLRNPRLRDQHLVSAFLLYHDMAKGRRTRKYPHKNSRDQSTSLAHKLWRIHSHQSRDRK